MLRIGICDDVYDARLVLRSTLERVLERRTEGQFFEFSSGEGLLRWLGHHAGELDLVFLDMEMGELDGMETARRLRAADRGLQLVFVTGYADHVFDGYSVGALGYLMKPPKQEQLEEVLDRAQAALYRELGRVWRRLPQGWRTLVLSSHTEFERTFGRPADKKRKLYNGMLKCDLFMYGNV